MKFRKLETYCSVVYPTNTHVPASGVAQVKPSNVNRYLCTDCRVVQPDTVTGCPGSPPSGPNVVGGEASSARIVRGRPPAPLGKGPPGPESSKSHLAPHAVAFGVRRGIVAPISYCVPPDAPKLSNVQVIGRSHRTARVLHRRDAGGFTWLRGPKANRVRSHRSAAIGRRGSSGPSRSGGHTYLLGDVSVVRTRVLILTLGTAAGG